MNNVILIDQEYGNYFWVARLSDSKIEAAKRRWKSMRGLNCLVPVTMIFPGARRISKAGACRISKAAMSIPPAARRAGRFFSAHVHQADDSFFDALPRHKVPEAKDFEIEGLRYSDDELLLKGRNP